MKNKLLLNITMFGKYTLYVLVLLSFVLNLTTAKDGVSQGIMSVKEAVIDIDLVDVPVERVFKEIEKSSRYTFVYNHSKINNRTRVSVKSKNQTLDQLLLSVAEQANLSFRQVNDKISVKQHDSTDFTEKVTISELARDITGKVTDQNGEPLPGATVLEKGTTNGTITDFEGNFSLSVNDGATLLVSFIGFRSTELVVGDQSTFQISLEEDSEQLDEVVITGYGSQIRRDLTGSIAKVKSEDLTSFSSLSMDQSLQGLAPGIQVSSSSGVPGAPTRVMIRGTNSVSSGTEPLWIIDGMILMGNGQELEGLGRSTSVIPQNPLSMINPNDIESIEVLKDASATAIYGNRGSGGVIIVTTKSGKGQQGTFNVNYQQGVSDVVRGPEEIGVVDGDEWLSLMDAALSNNGQPAFDPNDVLNSGRDPNAVLDRSQTTNTNWYDIVLRQGSFKDLGISASKGTDNTSYYISGQYRKDESILSGNEIQRISARANLDFEPVEHIQLALRTTVTYSDNDRAPNGGAPGGNSNIARPGYNAANSSIYPWLPIYHPTAVDPVSGNPLLFDPLSGRNPVASLNPNNFRNDLISFRSVSLFSADYFIPWVQGLKLHSEFGYDFFQVSSIEWGNTVLRENSAYAFDNSQTFNRSNYNVYLNYNKDIGANHNLGVTMGTESTEQATRTRNTEADGLIGAAKEVGSPGNVQRVSNGYGGEVYFRGIFGRLNYKFMDRYLVTGSLRRDGTSIFTKENRYGLFSAVSAGWIISEESFMNQQNWLEFLKLRVSYGQTGNSNIDPLATETGYATWGRYGDVGAGDLLTRIGNKDVTWETTTATDVGVDFELFANRLSGSVVYYRQDVSDMLYQVPIPQSSGIFSNSPTIWQNIGDMTNQGVEYSLNAIIVDKNQLRWDVGFNFTTNRNEVTRLTNETDEIYNVNSSGLVTRVGSPLSYFRLARYAGIHEQGGYPMIEEMDLTIFDETGERVATGNLIPATRSNMEQHLFDNTDKTALPTFFGGVNTNVSYMGFDLNAYFSFSGGNYIFDEAEYDQTTVGNPVLRSDMLNNTWTPENTSADYPLLMSNRRYDVINDDGTISPNERFDWRRTGQRTDNFLKKADYLRLRSLSLGYTVPRNVLDKLKIQRLRVYVMANNLWTITGFDGYDPEVVSTGGGFQSRNIGQGWVNIQIPQVKTYSFGINVGF